MDSLSGKQVKDLKELYSSIYEVEQPAEKPVEESISEINFDEYFESLSEEKKKNFFQRIFKKYMDGPDYGNKRKKEEEEKINKQVDDYVEKNKGNKPINKVNVDDETSGSAVLTKKNDTTNNDSSNTDNSDTKNKVNNDFKNTSLYKTSANNPDNFKDKQSQKDYLKLLNDPNVNPAEIDGTKYFNDKINKIDTKVKVDTEIKKNEVIWIIRTSFI